MINSAGYWKVPATYILLSTAKPHLERLGVPLATTVQLALSAFHSGGLSCLFPLILNLIFMQNIIRSRKSLKENPLGITRRQC